MPESKLIGAACLMRRAFENENLELTTSELLGRLLMDPNDAHAAMDLSTLFELGGDAALALEFQETALALQQTYREHTPGVQHPIRLLAIKSRGVIMDNMPIEFLLEESEIQLDSMYVGQGIPTPNEIPEHDIAIVAICESDTNQPLLENLQEILSQWPRPVLNAPASIANLSRERLGNVIQEINGLVFARSMRLQRSELHAQVQTLASIDSLRELDGWIIRPTNSHAGHGLERFSSRSTLDQYLAKTPGNEFLLAPFINYQSPDGNYRKYRIALIQGESFPVHMAISQRWMVHYLNADMLDNAQHRDEEAAFMQHYESGFGRRHGPALQTLYERLGLEYVVLDCAETSDGDFLLFEADNGAVVHSMDPVDLFPYKKPAMHKIFDAFTAMLASIGGQEQPLHPCDPYVR